MSTHCQDRDLLCIEPIAFLGGGMPYQQLAGGSDGTISGTTFTSSGSDFLSAGVTAGMVLCTYVTAPEEARAWEIVSVDSAASLTVSVLRADPEGPAIAPPADTGLNFAVRTFAAQIAEVSSALDGMLRRLEELRGAGTAEFADPEPLRAVAVAGVLARAFLARAESADGNDVHWTKAKVYREESARLQQGLRLSLDVDEDGTPDETQTPGHLRLRRT
jgi:hypothetical protein